MSNERPNEFLSWRGQLTPPDALPEQSLEDKELSWQRLAERLQKEPRRRGVAWWIAAACLILAFFFPATHLFRTRPTHPNRIAHRPPAQREPVTAAPSHPEVAPSAQSHPATSAPSTASDNHQPISHSNKGEIAPIKNFPPTNTIPATSAPSSNSNYGEIAAIKPNSPTDTLLAAIPPPASQPSAPPPRRQLRIIYLNELNKDPGPSVASTRQPAFLHLGTAAATADWTASQQNIPIIKIEISSSHNH
jgi:hypothetical protein